MRFETRIFVLNRHYFSKQLDRRMINRLCLCIDEGERDELVFE